MTRASPRQLTNASSIAWLLQTAAPKAARVAAAERSASKPTTPKNNEQQESVKATRERGSRSQGRAWIARSNASASNLYRKRTPFDGLEMSEPTPKSISRASPMADPESYSAEARIERMRLIRRRSRGKTESMTRIGAESTPPLLLTFDAFHTLYTPAQAVPLQYHEVAKAFGYKVSEYKISKSFPAVFKAMNSEYPGYGKAKGISVEEWWSELIRRVFREHLVEGVVLDPIFISVLYQRFATADGYRLFDDVLPLMQQIGTSFNASSWSPKRTMLGVISNSDSRTRSVLPSLGIDLRPALYPPRFAPVHYRDQPSFGPSSVSFTTLSYDLDTEKPDPRVFDAALKSAQQVLGQHAAVARLTRSGKDILSSVRDQFWHMHVGDSLEKDVLPALAAGWDAVLLDRSSETPVENRVTKGRMYTAINSLTALPSVLTATRADSAMHRGRVVRANRRALGPDKQWLDFEDSVDEDGTIGLKPSHIRTADSQKYLGSGEGIEDLREARRRRRQEAWRKYRRAVSAD